MVKVRHLKVREQRSPTPLMQNVLNALYTSFVITCFFVFFSFIKLNILGHNILIPLSCVPYTFLYPISYVALRLYGYRQINNMIASMIISSMLFVLLIRGIHYISNFDLFYYSHNLDPNQASELNTIIESSIYMYLAGLIAMPLSIYVSFYVLKLLKFFNVVTLSIATVAGEIVNTYIVFPIGLHQHFTIHELFSGVILGAMLFKIGIGVLLSIATIIFLRIYE